MRSSAARAWNERRADGDQASSLQEHLGQSRRPPVLARAEGARRCGGQLRGRQGEVPGTARGDRPAHGAARLSVDRVRGRHRLPRGVEGHGRTDPERRGSDRSEVVSFIVGEEIDDYAAAHTTPPPAYLSELAEETRANLRAPQMLTGTIEGRFLEMLVYGLQARRVLELGTYSGYSSLSMAAGLPEGGHIDTCEFDETHAEVARRYHAPSPLGDRITIHMGPALETIERLGGEWDFVFVDADKENYANYYEALLPRLGPSGLMGMAKNR